MGAGCLFCRIVEGSLRSKVVAQDSVCVAIEDIAPQAPVHLLVLPREHIASVAALTEAGEPVLGHLARVAADLARQRKLEAHGYRLVLNHGMDGGATVDHLHMHLLGGRKLSSMG